MGRLLKGVQEQRDELIVKMLAEGNGHINIKEMVRQLSNHSLFAESKNQDVISQYIYRVIRRKGITLKSSLKHEAHQSHSHTPSTVVRVKSPIQTFITQYQISLPVGCVREFDRFIKALTDVVCSVEEQAMKVPKLEQKIIELESKVKDLESRSPDDKLLEENIRLSGVVEKQANMIAKWKIDNGYCGDRKVAVDKNLVIITEQK